jgi:hypothetical protein
MVNHGSVDDIRASVGTKWASAVLMWPSME